MKILTVLGTRPQFIKSAVVSREIAKYPSLKEVIVDTGQHFDENMSEVFIRELAMPQPKYRLNINRLAHGAMIGQMLERIEDVLIKEKPDLVLVYGDTNTTLAGALAAKKLQIKIAHIEAGLRSFNMKMPEEVNRTLTDRLSNILFCPTDRAVTNLEKEGFKNFKSKIVKSGDVMQEAAYFYSKFAKKPAFNIPEKFALATIHRAENTDNIQRLKSILSALNRISKEIDIILPIHPRTRAVLAKNNIETGLELTDPVGYLEMIYLLQNCSLVLTDSGGLQKEAFFFKRPSIILRNETEWVELAENGFAVLAGSNVEKIYRGYNDMLNKDFDYEIDLYGDGQASKIIVEELLK